MNVQPTPVLLAHINTVLDTIRDNGLDAGSMHVRTDRQQGWNADSRVSIEVNSTAQVLAWAAFHEIVHQSPVRLVVSEWTKGTNIHYRFETETLDWFLWLHSRAVTADELLPGVEVDWEPVEDEKRRHGRITVDQLRAAVKP